MPRFVDTVPSRRRRERVFDYMADFASVAEWDPTVTEAEALDPAPGPGARFRVVVRALGRETEYVYETVAYERPNRVVVRAETSSVISLDTITFAEAGDGHRDDLRRRADPQGAGEAARAPDAGRLQAPGREREGRSRARACQPWPVRGE